MAEGASVFYFWPESSAASTGLNDQHWNKRKGSCQRVNDTTNVAHGF